MYQNDRSAAVSRSASSVAPDAWGPHQCGTQVVVLPLEHAKPLDLLGAE
jgi:hypothetical protein